MCKYVLICPFAPLIFLPADACSRRRTNLQAGQVDVLDDAAAARQHRLLQEEAAQLQRCQAHSAF